jgi:hypothetical protein
MAAMTIDDLARAERVGRRRAGAMTVLAMLFLTQQGVYLSLPDHLVRAVDFVRASAWVLLTLAFLAALYTGGSWFERREIRALVDDESARAHRADALALGFLFAMLVGAGLYVAAMFTPLTGRLAIHAMVSAGLCTAMIRFGMLERRAYRGG